MQKVIKTKINVRDKYRAELIAEGVEEEVLKALEESCRAKIEAAYESSKTAEYKKESWNCEIWQQVKQRDFSVYTGCELDLLYKIGIQITSLPENQTFHRMLLAIFEKRRKSIEDRKGIDWATGEALAFATLINEGYRVRLSGQDVERGTFSHRHAHVFYQDRDGHYCPIAQSFNSNQDEGIDFVACNSPLSEYAVLGFEYGYAQQLPNTLTIWEA
jgi:2-oxoglutarate dehydrogenase E1 component